MVHIIILLISFVSGVKAACIWNSEVSENCPSVVLNNVQISLFGDELVMPPSPIPTNYSKIPLDLSTCSCESNFCAIPTSSPTAFPTGPIPFMELLHPQVFAYSTSNGFYSHYTPFPTEISESVLAQSFFDIPLGGNDGNRNFNFGIEVGDRILTAPSAISTEQKDVKTLNTVLKTPIIYRDDNQIDVAYQLLNDDGLPYIPENGQVLQVRASVVLANGSPSMVTCSSPDVYGIGECVYAVPKQSFGRSPTASVTVVADVFTTATGGYEYFASNPMSVSLNNPVVNALPSGTSGAARVYIDAPEKPLQAGEKFNVSVKCEITGIKQYITTSGGVSKLTVDLYDFLPAFLESWKEKVYFNPSVVSYLQTFFPSFLDNESATEGTETLNAGSVNENYGFVEVVSALLSGQLTEAQKDAFANAVRLEVTPSSVSFTLADVSLRVNADVSSSTFSNSLYLLSESVTNNVGTIPGSVNSFNLVNDIFSVNNDSGALLIRNPEYMGLFAYATKNELVNSYSLTGKYDETTIVALGILNNQTSPVVLPDASCSSQHSKTANPSDYFIEINGYHVTLGSSNHDNVVELPITVSYGLLSTTVNLGVWWIVRAKVVVEDQLLNLII